MIGADLTFPYRLRYAAYILREVNIYENYSDGAHRGYTATELEDIADEYEATERHRRDELAELTELVQSVGGSGAWTLDKANILAEKITHAGYRKESSDQ